MFYIIFVIFAACIAQMQILPLAGVRFDLLLIVTCYYGFLYGINTGLVVGLVSGLAQDVFSGGVLGVAPAGLVLCGLLAGYTRKILLLRYWMLRVAIVFIFTILNLAVYSFLIGLFSQGDYLGLFKKHWFIISTGNSIIAGVLFWLVDRFE